MSTNTVCSARTVQFDSPTGPVGVILMNLVSTDPDIARSLVREAADRFKLQRLSSPLRTETLLITITGGLSADRFCREWRAAAMEDFSLALMMLQLHRAEVIQTSDALSSPTTASLLPLTALEPPESNPPIRRETQGAAKSGSCSTFTPLLTGPVPA
jgi:hypothetical protein